MATPSSTDRDPGRAALACARTLARRPDLALSGEGGGESRGESDALACRHRFALPESARHWRPADPAGLFFDALVDARAEALGARWLPGIASNLARRPPPERGPAQVGRWAWDIFQGLHPVSCPAALAAALAPLAACLDDAQAYARQAGSLGLHLAASQAGQDLAAAEPVAAAPDPAQADGEGKDEEGEDGSPADGKGKDTAPGVPPPPLPEALARGYQAYTRRHDRVVEAAALASPAELDQLRARLDGELLPYRRLVARLAHRLQRLLLARQRRHWQLDQEEGLLDPSRLARLVADPSRAAIFRTEAEGPFKRTAVTLLLDNSGSMKGHPIAVAAITADILARSLERCGIPVEILGFTTADWEGGAPRQEWEKAGRPPAPGRLNALRHIVYKSMDSPWRRSRLGLGLMLKDGILKENIDGEALAWACQRLLKRPEPRRLLIVISDGAPMDKSTVEAHGRNYLEQHLHQVIAWVEKETDLELRAIGIGHQVGRYYARSVTLRKVDELGAVLAARLEEWLG